NEFDLGYLVVLEQQRAQVNALAPLFEEHLVEICVERLPRSRSTSPNRFLIHCSTLAPGQVLRIRECSQAEGGTAISGYHRIRNRTCLVCVWHTDMKQPVFARRQVSRGPLEQSFCVERPPNRRVRNYSPPLAQQ